MKAWRRVFAVLASGAPLAVYAATKPTAWSFPGAELVLGAGGAVIVVLLGRALAAPTRRREDAGKGSRDA